jgi:hypothetical protein
MVSVVYYPSCYIKEQVMAIAFYIVFSSFLSWCVVDEVNDYKEMKKNPDVKIERHV